MGLEKAYYETGKLYIETPYFEGEKHGECIVYFKSGIVKKRTFFVEGNKNGIEKIYDKSGAISKEVLYYMGLKCRNELERFINDKVSKKTSWSNDSMRAISKEYYRSGELQFEKRVDVAKEKVEIKEYFRDGKLKRKQIYINGVKK